MANAKSIAALEKVTAARRVDKDAYRSWTFDDRVRLLQDLADGHRMNDCAMGSGRSRTTISQNLKRLRGSMGARTTAHLIAIAFRKGLIR